MCYLTEMERVAGRELVESLFTVVGPWALAVSSSLVFM